MASYPFNTISTTTGEKVHLKFIESFREIKSEEDEIIDKLKGDIGVIIRTVSGAEYILSMNSIKMVVGDKVTYNEAFNALSERWSTIHIMR
jgi:hypothetical protein